MSRQYVASNEILTKYTCEKITATKHPQLFRNVDDDPKTSPDHRPWDMKRSRNFTTSEPVTAVLGVRIGGWTITSLSSVTIANQKEMEDLSSVLEDIANDPIQDWNGTTIEGEKCTAVDNRNICDTIPTSVRSRRKRRLCLPEMIFLKAFVNLQFAQKLDLNLNDLNTFAMTLSFTAKDALKEWSDCHRYIPNDDHDHHQLNQQLHHDATYYKGVSIIKSVDAKLWAGRIIPSDFNYDWTFSTPYTGSISVANHTLNRNKIDHQRNQNPQQLGQVQSLEKPEEDKDDQNHKYHTSSTKNNVSDSTASWISWHESGFDKSLLTDQNIPILYFDEIKLFEDDMHDNGYTSLSCKIRVMPSCLLLLMSMFVRVDYVMIRVKETRIFIPFPNQCSIHKMAPTNLSSHKIWRDISWRECSWDQLKVLGLSDQVKSWRIEDMSSMGLEQVQHQQKILDMIRMLPLVPLPADLPDHSFLNLMER